MALGSVLCYDGLLFVQLRGSDVLSLSEDERGFPEKTAERGVLLHEMSTS